MTDKRIVLVDGVAGYWGGRVAAQLMSHPELHVIGLDDSPPEKEIKDLDFIQADIRNPLLVELLRGESGHGLPPDLLGDHPPERRVVRP